MENSKRKPQLIIIAGPNGSGKSTIFPALQNVERDDWSLEPVRIKDDNFVNPDNIAKNYSLSDIAAGRKTIKTIKYLIENGEDFAVETTMSGRTLEKHLKVAQQKGYNIYIIFMALRSYELSMNRVCQRALLGRHYIPMANIIKRYSKSLNNFFNVYKKYANTFWAIADNSTLEINVLYWGLNGTNEIYSLSNDETFLTEFIDFESLKLNDVVSPIIFRKIKQKIENELRNRPDGNYVAIQGNDGLIKFINPRQVGD